MASGMITNVIGRGRCYLDAGTRSRRMRDETGAGGGEVSAPGAEVSWSEIGNAGLHTRAEDASNEAPRSLALIRGPR